MVQQLVLLIKALLAIKVVANENPLPRAMLPHVTVSVHCDGRMYVHHRSDAYIGTFVTWIFACIP
jgi:hypothetical protein